MPDETHSRPTDPLASGRTDPRHRHPLHQFPGRFTRPGTAPGDLSRPAGTAAAPAVLSLIDYDAGEIVEHQACTLAEAREFFTSPHSTWLHVQGAPTEELLRAVGDAYGLHPLALEDVLHTGQRAKVEEYDGQLFTILGAPEAADQGMATVQLSLFLGDTWLVSFYSGREDPFAAVRERLRNTGSRVRRLGVDYLYYSLIDTMIDHVFPQMEYLGERIEALELSVFDDPNRAALDEIHHLKRELVLLRRLLWPQRDALGSLTRGDHTLIKTEARLYLRDCYDHAAHALDLVESYREMASSLLEVYLSSLSNRMNDVMKVLTIIATLFIPLSFIVGVYGMNFDRSSSPWNMPELGLHYGYPLLWLFMLLVAGGMLLYFRRKHWF